MYKTEVSCCYIDSSQAKNQVDVELINAAQSITHIVNYKGVSIGIDPNSGWVAKWHPSSSVVSYNHFNEAHLCKVVPMSRLLVFWCRDKNQRSIIYIQDVLEFKEELQTPNNGCFSAQDITTIFPSSLAEQRQLKRRMENVLDVERSNNKHQTRSALKIVAEVFVNTRFGRIQITEQVLQKRNEEERLVQVLPMDTNAKRTGSKHEEYDSDSESLYEEEEEEVKIVHAANNDVIVHVVGGCVVMGSNEPYQGEENLHEDAYVAELQGSVSTVAVLNQHVLFLTNAGELFVLGDKPMYRGDIVTSKLRIVPMEDKIERIEAYFNFVVAHSQENVHLLGPLGLHTIIKKDIATFVVSVHGDCATPYVKRIEEPVDAAYKLEKEIDRVRWEIERLEFEFNESMKGRYCELEKLKL